MIDRDKLREAMDAVGLRMVEIDASKDGSLTFTEIKDGFTHITIDPGPVVLCDLCNKDYTNSDATGGILFTSNAVCPDCAPRFRQSAKELGEEQYIRAEAKEGETFRDFVYRIR